MRLGMLRVLLLAAFAAGAYAQSELLKYVGKMPGCGLTCIMEEVPLSVCGSLANVTCLCTDPELYVSTQNCVAKGCENPLDAIDVARLEAEACQRPTRDRRHDLDAVLVVLLLGVITVLVRLYARWSTIDSFMNDDWIMLTCVVLYVPFLIIGQYAGRVAFGRDIWKVDTADLTMGLKLFYIAQSFYLVCLALTKLSLLCFFLRIFPNVVFRWITYITMVITGLSTTIFVFMQIFQCTPVSYNWEGWKGGFASHKCVEINTLVLTAAGFSIGLDSIILILPLPLLFGLRMSWKSKAAILVMFSLGIFVLITACVRLRYIILYKQSLNPTWDHTDVLIWSGIEVAVSMIVTSLPAIRILLRDRVISSFRSKFSKGGLSGNSGSRTQNEFTGNSKQSSTTGTKDHEFHRMPEPPGTPAGKAGSKFSVFTITRKGGNNESEETLELGNRIGDNANPSEISYTTTRS